MPGPCDGVRTLGRHSPWGWQWGLTWVPCVALFGPGRPAAGPQGSRLPGAFSACSSRPGALARALLSLVVLYDLGLLTCAPRCTFTLPLTTPRSVPLPKPFLLPVELVTGLSPGSHTATSTQPEPDPASPWVSRLTTIQARVPEQSSLSLLLVGRRWTNRRPAAFRCSGLTDVRP